MKQGLLSVQSPGWESADPVRSRFSGTHAVAARGRAGVPGLPLPGDCKLAQLRREWNI